MVSESLHGGGGLLCFFMSPGVKTGNGDKLDIPKLQRTPHTLRPTPAEANGAQAHAIIGAEHAAARQDRCDRRTRRRSFEKFSPFDVLANHHYKSSMTI